jgi:hypothetical protein
MSEKQHQHNSNSRRNIFYNADVQDIRRGMNRRRDHAIQIRKERKENVLRKRRLLQGGSNIVSDKDGNSIATAESTQQQPLISEQEQFDSFRQILAVYCCQPTASPNNSPEYSYQALDNVRGAFYQASSNVVKGVLRQLLDTVDHSALNTTSSDSTTSVYDGRLLVSRLIYDLTTTKDPAVCLTILSVILQISSVSSSVTSNSTMSVGDGKMKISSSMNDLNDTYGDDPNYSYYGRNTIRWTDLLLESHPTGVTLLSVLLQILTKSVAISSSPEIIETSCTIIGNLVQDEKASSASALLDSLLPQYWYVFVQHLPVSSYCCAALLRMDCKHYGIEFCSVQNNQDSMNNDSNYNSNRSKQSGFTQLQICALLENEKTAIDAAWILDGLCRREDDAIDFLCQPPNVLSTLVQQLYNRTIVLSSPNTVGEDIYEFLIPALRAFGNIGTACEGRFVPLLLCDTLSQFLTSINTLLEIPTSGKTSTMFSSIFVEAAYVAGCLLTDAGWPNHPSTTIAVRNLVPRLKAVLLLTKTTFEIRVAAISALANAFREPPSPVLEIDHINPFSCTSHQLKAISNDILTNILWNNPEENLSLMRSLVDLLHVKDSDAVLSSLQVIDRFLRTGSESEILSVRTSFEECDGVDALERIGDVFPSTSTEALLAADLLNEFFDDDEDKDSNLDNIQHSLSNSPVLQDNQFVFGLPANSLGPCGITTSTFNTSINPDRGAMMTSPPTENPLSAALLLSTMPIGSKGRGKPIPAWMTQVNSGR